MSVPPELYTRSYYLTDCGGYEQFVATHGTDLPLRLQKAFSLGAVRAGECVLDVGCGRGEIVLHSARRGAAVVGIDYSLDAVEIAREVVQSLPEQERQRVTLMHTTAEELPFPANTFDVVFMLDVVEHLYPAQLTQILAEIHRVLKPEGRLVIHTAPNRTFVETGFRFYTRHIHALINRLFKRDHTLDLRPGISHLVHVNELTAPELRGYLKPFRRSRVWHEVYIGDQKHLRARIRGAITHLYPLSALWPLNRLFAYWIWAVAVKQPAQDGSG